MKRPVLALVTLGILGSALTVSALGSETSSVPTTLDRHAMYAGGGWHHGGGGGHWHGGGGGGHWHGGGGHWHGGGGGWHGGGNHWYGAGWYGGRYYPAGYYNWGWTIPVAAATTAAVISSQNSAPVYACQATYHGYVYQGSYRPGGPCYINIGGSTVGISTYRR